MDNFYHSFEHQIEQLFFNFHVTEVWSLFSRPETRLQFVARALQLISHACSANSLQISGNKDCELKEE